MRPGNANYRPDCQIAAMFLSPQKEKGREMEDNHPCKGCIWAGYREDETGDDYGCLLTGAPAEKPCENETH